MNGKLKEIPIGAICEFELLGMCKPSVNGKNKYNRLLIRQIRREKVISLCEMCETKKGSKECENCEMEAYALVNEEGKQGKVMKIET
jgi:hypothetical protein